MSKYQLRLKPAAWLRLFGLILLGGLLWQLDMTGLIQVIKAGVWQIILVAVILNIPMILIKATRWWYLMRSQDMHYPFSRAFLTYFSSIFLGLLTPGRLGELTRAIYVSTSSPVSTGQALATVLADRLFDLYALIITGSLALLPLTELNLWQNWIGVMLLIGLSVSAPLLFITNRGFTFIQAMSAPLGQTGSRLFRPGSWLLEMRAGLRRLSWSVISVSILLTMLAYSLFFGQCYLLAVALRLPTTFISTSYAVALGSLVTLLPISISGIGTRDAAIVAYLNTVNVPAEKALAFSLLVFFTFYIGGGIMGAVAWWIKPIPLDHLKLFSSKRPLNKTTEA